MISVHAPIPRKQRFASLQFWSQRSKQRLTQFSFASNLHMACRKGDVFEKNSLFFSQEMEDFLLAIDHYQPFSTGTLHLE